MSKETTTGSIIGALKGKTLSDATTRDLFAAAILQATCTDVGEHENLRGYCNDCYRIADAMMAARKGSDEGA